MSGSKVIARQREIEVMPFLSVLICQFLHRIAALEFSRGFMVFEN